MKGICNCIAPFYYTRLERMALYNNTHTHTHTHTHRYGCEKDSLEIVIEHVVQMS